MKFFIKCKYCYPAYILLSVVFSIWLSCSVNTVELKGPVVSGMIDTVVAVNDSVTISATVSGKPGENIVVWERVGKEDTRIVTKKGCFRYMYGRSEYGLDTLILYAVNNNNIKSLRDTVIIDVRTYSPVLKTEMNDTSVDLHDSFNIIHNCYDTNSNLENIVILHSDSVYRFNHKDTVFNLDFGASDTGFNQIVYYYTDTDSFRTQQDTFMLYIDPCIPEIKDFNDTLINVDQELCTGISVVDRNDTSHTILFKQNSDTLRSDSLRISFSGSFSDVIEVYAIDKDGFSDRDTMHIEYNDYPGEITGSDISDTLVIRKYVNKPVLCPDTGIEYVSVDNDSIRNDIKYLILSGNDKSELDTLYSGFDTRYMLEPDYTGRVYWKIGALDTVSDSAVFYMDSSFVLKRLEVCFTGHSIVVGMGGDMDRGGFRKMVIDSLCSYDETIIQPVGPRTTDYLQDEEYDSVMAKIGNTSLETLRMMFDNYNYKPDLWIYMSGVNGNYYSSDEIKYTLLTINRMFYLAPESPVVFINGLPVFDEIRDYEEKTQRLYTFNDTIETYVKEKRDQGYNISLVDGFSIMSEDSVMNRELFNDNLHPNNTGYDSLGVKIIEKIREYFDKGVL